MWPGIASSRGEFGPAEITAVGFDRGGRSRERWHPHPLLRVDSPRVGARRGARRRTRTPRRRAVLGENRREAGCALRRGVWRQPTGFLLDQRGADAVLGGGARDHRLSQRDAIAHQQDARLPGLAARRPGGWVHGAPTVRASLRRTDRDPRPARAGEGGTRPRCGGRERARCAGDSTQAPLRAPARVDGRGALRQPECARRRVPLLALARGRCAQRTHGRDPCL